MADPRNAAVIAAQVAVGLSILALVAGPVLGQPVGLAFVETDSMTPTLEPGDGFVAVPTPLAGEIEEGDVVTFPSRSEGDRLTTHRVVGRTESGFVTRGDANPFTDQQSGEPPVPRDRILAVALQVGGTVVVIPGFEDVVGVSQGVVAALGGLLGLGGTPQQLATALLAATGAAFVLDELLAREGRDDRRSRQRTAGYEATKLLVAGVALVLAAATLAMVLSSGATVIAYDSVEPSAAADGGIVAGDSREVPVTLRNGGFAPTVAFVSTPDDAALSRETVVLGPRSEATVDVTVAAPTTPGSYEQRVVQHRYVAVLPPTVLRPLHAVNPWLARLAVDGVLGGTLFVVGRRLLGRGRVRIRSERGRPALASLRRAVRSLYR
jgi:signal peptidase